MILQFDLSRNVMTPDFEGRYTIVPPGRGFGLSGNAPRKLIFFPVVRKIKLLLSVWCRIMNFGKLYSVRKATFRYAAGSLCSRMKG